MVSTPMPLTGACGTAIVLCALVALTVLIVRVVSTDAAGGQRQRAAARG